MTASSHAVGAEAASPAATLGGAQTGACLSPSQRRSLQEGDIVTWDATRVSMGSPEATAHVTSGSIVGFYDDRQGVQVKRARYSPYKIPITAITSVLSVKREASPPSKPQRVTRQKGPGPGSVAASPATTAASGREESQLTRKLKSQIEALGARVEALESERAKKIQAKHSAKSYQKTVGQAKLEKAQEQIKQLEGQLQDVNRELQKLEDIAQSERPLRGRDFRMKTSERGKPVPDNIRDLVVELRTRAGIAGEKSFEVAQMTLEAVGAKLKDRVKQHDALALSNACLVETALMMEDDQYRRMAEELREGPEREIRAEKWSEEEAEEAGRVEQAGIAAHKLQVLDKLEGWLHNPRYKPKDLPDPGEIDVGEPAATGEDFELALCALLFLGMDATTHAR